MKRLTTTIALILLLAYTTDGWCPPPSGGRDPRIGTITASKWCVANASGTGLACTTDTPAGAGDVVGASTAQTWGDGTGPVVWTYSVTGTDPTISVATGGFTFNAALLPSAATTTLGSTSAEWGGLYLGDAKPIYFQADQSVTLTPGAGTLTLGGANLALGANNLTMTGSIAATGSRVTKGWFTDAEFTNYPTVGGAAVFNQAVASGSSPAFNAVNITGANSLGLGTASTNAGSINFKNATNANELVLQSGVTAASITYTLPTAAPTANGAAFIGNTDGTTAFTVNPSFSTLNLVATNSLNVGTAGSAVGQVKFKNATSGAITLEPITGALGTPTLVLGTTFTDAKWCSYATATGFTCNQDAPAGSGDVTGVGNCASGACLDGTSDGGSSISLYDTSANYVSMTAGVRSLALTPSDANAENLTITFGNNDNTIALSSSTGAATLNATAFDANFKSISSTAATTTGGYIRLKEGSDNGTDYSSITGAADAGTNPSFTFAGSAAGSEDATFTATANMWTWNSSTSAAFTFTPAVTVTGLLTGNSNLSIGNGATGAGSIQLKEDSDNGTDYSSITGAADAGSYPSFTFSGSQGSEDLTLAVTAANTWTVSSSTGVTDIKFQGAAAANPLNLATTGTISGAIPIVTKSDEGANTITAAQAYGSLVILGHADAISDLTLPDYQADPDADHAKLGASVCVWAASAYAHTIHPSADDKIRTSNGTLNGAGAGVTYTTASTPIGGFVCFILTDAASDVGHWTQFGMQGTWPIH